MKLRGLLALPVIVALLLGLSCTTTGPVITKIRYQDIEQGQGAVVWWTNVPTTGRVEYGLSQQYGLSTPWSEGLTTVNGYTLTELETSTNYYVRVRVKDAAGNETVSKGAPVPTDTACAGPEIFGLR
jgi:hypothetical protein